MISSNDQVLLNLISSAGVTIADSMTSLSGCQRAPSPEYWPHDMNCNSHDTSFLDSAITDHTRTCIPFPTHIKKHTYIVTNVFVIVLMLWTILIFCLRACTWLSELILSFPAACPLARCLVSGFCLARCQPLNPCLQCLVFSTFVPDLCSVDLARAWPLSINHSPNKLVANKPDWFWCFPAAGLCFSEIEMVVT